MTALDTITSKFDQLVKCTNALIKAVPSGSYEKELGLFANSQEDVRKEWASSIIECDHLKSEISTISDELSSANKKYEEERNNRINIENDRFQCAKSHAEYRQEVRSKCIGLVEECERLKSALDKTRDDALKSRQLLIEERKKHSAVEEEKIKLISKDKEIENKLLESIKECEILKMQLKQNKEDSSKLQQLFEEEKEKNFNEKKQERNDAIKIEEITKKLSTSVEECKILKYKVQLFEDEKKIYQDEKKKQEKKKAIEIAELGKKLSSSAEECKQLKIELEKSKNESIQSIKYLEEEHINHKKNELIQEKQIEELQKDLSASVDECEQLKIELKKAEDEKIKTELLKILEQSEKDRCHAVICDGQIKKIENLTSQLSACTAECLELKINLNKIKEESSRSLKLYENEKKKHQETYVEKNHLIKQIENIGDVQDKLLASLQEGDHLKDELEKAQQEAISIRQQLDDEKQKYCTLENEKNQLKKQISNNSEVQKNLTTLIEECESLKINIKNLQEDFDNCRQQLEEEKQKTIVLEMEKNQMNKQTMKNCDCEEKLSSSSLNYEKLTSELKKTQQELIDVHKKLDYEIKKCSAVEHKKNKLERQMTIARDMLVIEDCQDVIDEPLERVAPPVCQVNENVCSSIINTKNETKTIEVKNTTASDAGNESVATDFDESSTTDNVPLKPANTSNEIVEKSGSNKRKRKERNSSVEIIPKKQKKTTKKSKKSSKKISLLLDNEEIDKLSVENSQGMDFDDIDETFVVKLNPNKKSSKSSKKNSSIKLEEKITPTCTSDDEFDGIFEEVDEAFAKKLNDSSSESRKNNKKDVSVKLGEESTSDEIIEREIDETLNGSIEKNIKYNKKNVSVDLGEESTSTPDEMIVEKADKVIVEKLNNSLNKKSKKYNKKNVTIKVGEKKTFDEEFNKMFEEVDESFLEKLNDSSKKSKKYNKNNVSVKLGEESTPDEIINKEIETLNDSIKKKRKYNKKNVSINLVEESTLTSDEKSSEMIVDNVDESFVRCLTDSNKKSKKNVSFKLDDEILSTSNEKLNEMIVEKVKKKSTSNRKNKKHESLNLKEKALWPFENEMIIQKDNKSVSQKLPDSNKKYRKKNLPPAIEKSVQLTIDKFNEMMAGEVNEIAVQESSNKKYKKKMPTNLGGSNENLVEETDKIVIKNTDPLCEKSAEQIEEKSIDTSIDEPAVKPFDQPIDKLIENKIDYSYLPSPKCRKIRSSLSRISIKKPQQIEQKQMNDFEIVMNSEVAKNPLEDDDDDDENPNNLKLTPKIDANNDNNGLKFDSPIVSLEKLRATHFQHITQRVKRKMNISSLKLSK